MVFQRREQAVFWPRSKALGEPAAQLLSWDGKWLVPSAVRRSLGKPGSFSHSPTALTLPAAQLWIPSKESQKKYMDFMVSSLPLFSCIRPAVSLISDLNCVNCTIEAKVIIHNCNSYNTFLDQKSFSGKDFLQTQLPYLHKMELLASTHPFNTLHTQLWILVFCQVC